VRTIASVVFLCPVPRRLSSNHVATLRIFAVSSPLFSVNALTRSSAGRTPECGQHNATMITPSGITSRYSKLEFLWIMQRPAKSRAPWNLYEGESRRSFWHPWHLLLYLRVSAFPLSHMNTIVLMKWYYLCTEEIPSLSLSLSLWCDYSADYRDTFSPAGSRSLLDFHKWSNQVSARKTTFRGKPLWFQTVARAWKINKRRSATCPVSFNPSSWLHLTKCQ